MDLIFPRLLISVLHRQVSSVQAGPLHRREHDAVRALSGGHRAGRGE